MGVRILFRHFRLNDLQLRFGCLKTHTFLQSRDDPVLLGRILCPDSVRLSEFNRNPYLWLFWIEWKLEAARHDSNDGVRIAVQPDDLAEDVRVSAERISPDGVTQHGRLGVIFSLQFVCR